MKASVLEAAWRRAVSTVGVLTRAAERAGRAEAGVVDQDDQHVRRALRRPQRLDRRVLGVWVFCVVRSEVLRRVLVNR